MMIPKDIDQITEDDFQELIGKEAESKTIEYKAELPGIEKSEKIKFLANVSSFANASGGDIIFGIVEKDSIAENLIGINKANIDEKIRGLEGQMRDGIRPRIVGVETKPVELSNGKIAIVIRVPRSWQNPHMVTLQGHNKFYARTTKGRYPLDVDELRIAFNLSETITEKIKSFRASRITTILADEGPLQLLDNAKIILHVMPVASFGRPQSYDIKRYYQKNEKIVFIVQDAHIIPQHRYNFNGILAYFSPEGQKCYEYVQLFKNGIIEAVDSFYLMVREEKKIIPKWYESYVVTALNNYLFILKELSVEMPLIVSLSFCGIRGYSIQQEYQNWQVREGLREANTIEKDILLIPEVEVRSYEEKAVDILKPCFDTLWNTCGFERSLNYDENGKFIASHNSKS